MISPKKVKFNEFMSTDFPTFTLLTELAFDSDNGETSSYLNREAVASESYHGEFKRVHSYKYTENLNLKLTFIKEGFTDFTLEETRKVLTWLTAKKTASFLDVYDDIDSNAVVYSVLGGFTDIQLYKLGNNRTVGIVATFESVNPWAVSPLQTITKDMSSPADNSITININTDEPESAIYPRITIQQGASVIVNVNKPMINGNAWIDDDWMDGTIYYYADAGMYYYNKHNSDGTVVPTAQTTSPSGPTTSVIIKNTYVAEDNKTYVTTVHLANNIRREQVVLDGANKVVSSSSTSRVFGNDFDWNWLPLYNGANTITVIGNCTITFEYREVRKVGEW